MLVYGDGLKECTSALPIDLHELALPWIYTWPHLSDQNNFVEQWQRTTKFFTAIINVIFTPVIWTKINRYLASCDHKFAAYI